MLSVEECCFDATANSLNLFIRKCEALRRESNLSDLGGYEDSSLLLLFVVFFFMVTAES